ncbi:hypothetical protein JOF29_000281 [Kribbella aluminosa]|uniref:DUF4469 domain-containing protein n=1 Tax=Kribbella aluminosa TaxID=416017 RepID=A0ABS4UC23_9ACTN|nr:hypothetical protein [Kribbella aluminosa]MBP2349198.1 hypothetical protein [Kribbella aluminosa]
MVGWESLREDLLRYREESPRPLVVWPSPSTERRHERRFRIQLAAWATGIAGELHAKYGDLVELQVGALTFPGRQLFVDELARQLHGEPADRGELTADLLAPLTIRSGHHSKQDVLVTNHAAHQQVLITAGDLHSTVTDSSGAVVGLYVGPHNAPRIEFPIDPGHSRPVPALIGTASLVPDLGYAVPPGTWALVITLQTVSGFYLSTPLELTITS